MARSLFGNLFRDVPVVNDLFGLKSSADIAAGKQTAALGQAQGQLEQGYKRLSDLYAPYLQMGQEATSSLPGLSERIGSTEYGVPEYQAPREFQFNFNRSDFMNSPYYQMQKQAGEEGINRQMAARGLFASTPALQNIAKFNQDLASSGYDQEYNRQFGRQLQTYQTNRNAYQDYINTLRQMGLERYARDADLYGRTQGQAAMGQQFTGMQGNAAMGQASDLASIQTQKGNAQAAAEIARANAMQKMLSDLISAAGKSAPVPGAVP
jgi:hypothetical protein